MHTSIEAVAFRGGPSQVGYFACIEDAQAAVASLGRHTAIYRMVNPSSKPITGKFAPLRRGSSRSQSRDVQERTHLYVDVDSVHPEDQNATDAELALALARRDQVSAWVAAEWGADPCEVGMSGNGGWLLYALAEPITDAQAAAAIRTLASRFTDATAVIDPKVHDRARLMPMPGTVKAKYPATTERPHRMVVAVCNKNARPLGRAMIACGESCDPPTLHGEQLCRKTVKSASIISDPAADVNKSSISVGNRNDSLFAAARAQRDAGVPEADALPALTPTWVAAGLGNAEIARTVASAYKGPSAAAAQQIAEWLARVVAHPWTKTTRERNEIVARAIARHAMRAHKTELHLSVSDISIESALDKNMARRVTDLIINSGYITIAVPYVQGSDDARVLRLNSVASSSPTPHATKHKSSGNRTAAQKAATARATAARLAKSSRKTDTRSRKGRQADAERVSFTRTSDQLIDQMLDSTIGSVRAGRLLIRLARILVTPMTVDKLARAAGCSVEAANDALELGARAGVFLRQYDGRWVARIVANDHQNTVVGALEYMLGTTNRRAELRAYYAEERSYFHDPAGGNRDRSKTAMHMRAWTKAQGRGLSVLGTRNTVWQNEARPGA